MVPDILFRSVSFQLLLLFVLGHHLSMRNNQTIVCVSDDDDDILLSVNQIMSSVSVCQVE